MYQTFEDITQPQSANASFLYCLVPREIKIDDLVECASE